MAGDAPLLVTGAGRSRTAVRRLNLSGHSRRHIPPETWFPQPPALELPLRALLPAAEKPTCDRHHGSA